MTPGIFLIPLFPLLGAGCAYIAGLYFPKAAGWIATAAAVFSFAAVLACDPGEEALFPWLVIGNLRVECALRMDQLGRVMCLFVTGVGALIHLYSIGYMAEDPSKPRFFAYLNFFLFCMLILVVGANLPVMFVGWEGVGLCSYLLIGFWFKNGSYAAAGRKAFVVNRIGDAGLLLGMFLALNHFGTLDFDGLSNAVAASGTSDAELLTLIALCFFAGAVGKSAQIPLFVWLPDAMAGPTPVSALIHAATMVTAGVYLVARTAFIFDLAPAALFIVSCIALLTAFTAATIALVQNDIKKVLAYSTISQLGFMFLAAGAGAYLVAIFHVVTHAFFKACLFLGAGSVIHGCHHEQDMRRMGGLARFMPVTAVTYGIATLAIAGLYPFAGYESKHAIFEALSSTRNVYLAGWKEAFVIVAEVTAVFTAFYMTRSFVMTFLGVFKGRDVPGESPWTMTLPLVVLAALSTAGGIWVGGSLFAYAGPVFGGETFVPAEGGVLDGVFGSWAAASGIGLALLFYLKWKSVPGKICSALSPVSTLPAEKYYVDEIYRKLVVYPLERLAHALFHVLDQFFIDGTVNGTGRATRGAGSLLRHVQTGQTRVYALLIFAGLVFLMIFYLPG